MVDLIWVAWLGVAADLSVRGPVIIMCPGLAAISFICRRRNFQVIGDVFEYSAQAIIFLIVANSLSCLVIAVYGMPPSPMDCWRVSTRSWVSIGWHGGISCKATRRKWLDHLDLLSGRQRVRSGTVLSVPHPEATRERRLLWASMLSLVIVIASSAYIPASAPPIIMVSVNPIGSKT